jgi:uncharacterized delta-60 repeat protein
MVIQPDGQILVGGLFNVLGGQSRLALGRVTSSGVIDAGFDAGLSGPFGTALHSLANQPDGKIVLAGTFTGLGGQPRGGIGRVNGSSVLESTYDPGAVLYPSCLLVQPDNKILVGGYFTTVAGQPRTNLARLNPDGTLDANFNVSAQGIVVAALAVQDDGKIVVAGTFTNLAGEACTNVGRLTSSGGFDSSFHSSAIGGGAGPVAIQPDGRILVAGSFTSLAAQPRKYLGRLNSGGDLDITFNPAPDALVSGIALQADGKIIVCGGFTNIAGARRTYLARLYADGTVDTNFDCNITGNNPGLFPAYVNSAPIQADGKIVLGGVFTGVAGQPRRSLARLINTSSPTQSLSFTASTITWSRSGTCPELWRTAFDASTNDTDWIPLGAGARVPGGWQLTGVSGPPNANIRGRGFVVNGGRDTGFVEAFSRPVIQTRDPAFGFRSNQFGFQVAGSPGQAVVIEASAELTNWISVLTNTAGTGLIDFRDPASSTLARRFYRARFQQP